MTYLLQIYTAAAASSYETLSADDQKAIFDEYMAIGQAPGVHRRKPAAGS